MSQEFATRTFGAYDDVFLKLSRGQGIRILDYIGSWTKLRLGFLVAFDAAASLTGTPAIFIGICAEGDGGFAHPAPEHCVGVYNQLATWTRNTGGGDPFFATLNAWRAVKKVDGVLTDNSTNIQTLNLTTNVGVKRNMFIVEFEKGSPNWTIRLFGPSNSTGAQTDKTLTDLEAVMDVADITSAGVSNYSGAGQTLAVNEGTDGAMPYLCVWWGQLTAPLEIYAQRHKFTP